LSKLSDFLTSFIKDKKICILGFGREGRSTFNLFTKIGGFSSITIADLSPIDSVDGASLICGKNYQSTLNDFDIIMKSPGIVLEEGALKDETKLFSQTEVFMSVYRENIIGVTGTKGKSTTTTLIYHVLKSSGKNAVLLGNIGIPCFDGDFSEDDDLSIVFELSSHQLEYTEISPHMAVFLNIFPEHLDHYGTFEKYYDAKKNIYLFQKEGDLLVAHETVAPKNSPANVITFGDGGDVKINHDSFSYFGENVSLPAGSSRLVGAHNVNNIASAYSICRALGISKEQFLSSLSTYTPLPHRLQNIGEKDGITYYDDSISTIPQTAIQALLSLKNVGTLLVGGMDRGIDYSPLIEFLSDYDIENVIFMYDTGKRIIAESEGVNHKFKAHFAPDLKSAVDLAKKVTPKGTICLLSPSAASYGFFKNFEERGDKFKEYALS
jgi:UDP-N-acetylmuramoylalanine--D-glutamate ligase